MTCYFVANVKEENPPLESLTNLGLTCSVDRRTKLSMRLYLFPLKMDYLGSLLVWGDLVGLSGQHGSFNQ